MGILHRGRSAGTIGAMAAFVASLVIGCGDKESQSAGETAESPSMPVQAAPPQARAAPVACDLVSPDEIGELIGRPVRSTMPTEDPLYCFWNTGSTPGIVGDVRVSLDPNPIDAPGAIERMVARGGTRVSDLGLDAAWELRRNPDFYKVVSHRGDLVVEIVVFGSPPSVDAAQVVALARLVNERL
jgi:hypothetical protein